MRTLTCFWKHLILVGDRHWTEVIKASNIAFFGHRDDNGLKVGAKLRIEIK